MLRLACAAVAITAVIGVAHAEPITTDVTGTCPTAAALSDALAAEDVEPGPGWHLRVDSSSGLVTLQLQSPDGTVSTRTIDSSDCPAVAEAIALIARTTIEDTPEPEPKPRPEPEPTPTPTPEPKPEPEPTPPTATAPKRSQSRSRSYWLSASAGKNIASDIGDATFAQLDGGLAVRGPWHLRAVFATDSRDIAPHGMTVNIGQTTARAEAGRRWNRDDTWLRSTAGIGAVLLDVRVPELSGAPRVRRLHPVLTSTVTGGLRLAPHWSVRAEVAASVRPIVDRYTAGTAGEVGRTPRTGVSFGLGLEWAAFD